MQVTSIGIDKLEQRNNSRGDTGGADLANLMQSIKELGLLQPIGVMPLEDGNYEVIYGNRRLTAMKKLGWEDIPCAIRPTTEYEGETDLINLAENLQRSEVTLLEVGRYIKMLLDEGFTYDEMAVKLGVSRNMLRTASKEYGRVPTEMRSKVIVNTDGVAKRAKPGTMPLSTVGRVSRTATKYGLNKSQRKTLFDVATVQGFDVYRADDYAAAILNGEKQPQAIVESTNEDKRRITCMAYLDGDSYEKLHKRFIQDGPYKSMREVVVAGFNGQIRPGVKMRTV